MRLFAELDPAGVAVFVGVIGLVAAAFAREREHWGIRRIAFGITTACAGIALLILTPAIWWWSGLLYGSYQIYIGWAFISRRSRIVAERVDYVTSTAKVLTLVALADGELTPKAIAIIRETYTRAGFDANELREVDLTAAECERAFRGDGSDPERLLPRLQAACQDVSKHSDHQTRLIFLEAGVLIVASDGYVSRAGERLLRAAASWLGLSTMDVDEAWRRYTAATSSPVGTP